MRLDVCRPTDASLNVVAILEAIVWAWSNSESGMSWALPMTMVTAIVSPSARPRPRMTAPTIPERAAGQDGLGHDLPARGAEGEHRLALALRDGGDDLARDGDDRGQDHDREDHAGGEQADPERRSLEQRDPAASVFTNHASTVALRNGRQDEHAPQADDDRRDGGQQLDQEGQRDRDPRGASSAR